MVVLKVAAVDLLVMVYKNVWSNYDLSLNGRILCENYLIVVVRLDCSHSGSIQRHLRTFLINYDLMLDGFEEGLVDL